MLIDAHGHRKYLTPDERIAFIAAAKRAVPEVETFALTLAYSGVRISEALALSALSVDLGARALIVETLKKRRRGIYRSVPIPDAFIARLEAVHGLSEVRADRFRNDIRLWPWSRTTAWCRIKEIMIVAGLPAEVSKPKALRHAFGVKAVLSGVGLSMIARWLGHSDPATTAIYTTLMGPEERSLAERMWE